MVGKQKNTFTITSGWGLWVLVCRVASPKTRRNFLVYLCYEHTGLEGLENHYYHHQHYRHNHHHTGLEGLENLWGNKEYTHKHIGVGLVGLGLLRDLPQDPQALFGLLALLTYRARGTGEPQYHYHHYFHNLTIQG